MIIRPLALSALVLCTSAAPAPGYEIAVLRHGKVVDERVSGFADLTFGLPMTSNTRFDTASLGKHITAFAVYHLARTGHIDLRRSIRSYVPGLPSYAGHVTVQQLLWQTSGLRDYIELSALAGHQLGDTVGFDDVLQLMAMQHGLNFTPGTKYQYSNTNYVLLAELVHRVTGMSFAQYCNALVFKPLHMTHTTVRGGAGTIYSGLASSYWPGQNGYSEARDGSSVVGDGDIITTATDFLRWEAEVLHPHIDPAALRRVESPARLAGGRIVRQGLGSAFEFNRDFGAPGWTFDGGTVGFRSVAVAYPSLDAAIVVFTNLITDDGRAHLRKAANTWLHLHNPPDPPSTPQNAPAATRQHIDASDYTGAYYSPEVDRTLHVCNTGAGMVARQAFSPDVSLSEQARDTFAGSYWWLSTVTFHRDTSGHVTGFDAATFRAVQGIRYKRISNACVRV